MKFLDKYHPKSQLMRHQELHGRMRNSCLLLLFPLFPKRNECDVAKPFAIYIIDKTLRKTKHPKIHIILPSPAMPCSMLKQNAMRMEGNQFKSSKTKQNKEISTQFSWTTSIFGCESEYVVIVRRYGSAHNSAMNRWWSPFPICILYDFMIKWWPEWKTPNNNTN